MSLLARTTPEPPVRHVHLGLGNFFRAHQAWYTQHAPDGDQWGIAAFTGRPAAGPHPVADALTAQDGLYTLGTRTANGDRFEVVSSIAAVHRGDDHQAWLGYFADPQVQIATTTVTEAGYLRHANGSLDTGRVEVASDIAALRSDLAGIVRSAPAKLVAGLAARRRAGAGPITVVPCDNLPDNGRAFARVVRELADLVDPTLAAWIAANVAFVTTMVDRITPQPTPEDVALVQAATGVHDDAPVFTEPFSEWVLSGEFAAGRPRWEDAGATFAPDVRPFEDRKLWLLNGAHSLLAYAGPLRGHVTVADAMGDETCCRWLLDWWDTAAAHLDLPDGDVASYRMALTKRFENPRLHHRLDQIAADGSLKLPIRILPTLRQERSAGRVPRGATRALAAWVCHLRRSDATATSLTDARAVEFLALARGPLAAAVRAVLGALDPPLALDDAVVAAVLAQAEQFENTHADLPA